MIDYPSVQLHINGEWRAASDGRTMSVQNPASGEEIGRLAHADRLDLDAALVAVQAGFERWRPVSAYARSAILRRAADRLRERCEHIGRLMTMEQGKPLAEARAEVMAGADIIDWFAEEGRRSYGRVIPARAPDIRQMTVKEPVGPVAAFSPWNFPINQAVRKIAAALAAGCSIILKGPEETPASCAELVRAFEEAELPAGALNLLFGDPATISSTLIAHPTIRKVTFTGSTVVGKQIAALAGHHMKRATMELGGHAPALVFADADLDEAVRRLVAAKFRNAGQVCIAPTRILVQDEVADRFTERFVAGAEAIKVADGLAEGTMMGPLANARRVQAMERFVADAVQRGACLRTGGARIGNTGNFYKPTVLSDVPEDALVMNQEPFGPLAIINRFSSLDAAVSEANRLPYGLAAFAYTQSLKTAQAVSDSVQAGMVSINHHGLALIETPFGGVKESGYGTEGGADALEGYLNTKFVTQAGL